MKACFINPPIQDFYATSIRRQPLGLLYIMSSLASDGFDVELINGHTSKRHALPLPEEFSYLVRYMHADMPGIVFPFKQYSHFGMSFEEIERQILSSSADVFFIPNYFTPYHRISEKVILQVKRIKPGAKIVAGGYHASMYPEQQVRDAGADFVIAGEGEIGALALMRCFRDGGSYSSVPNLVYKNNDTIIINKQGAMNDINSIPVPAREYLKKRDLMVYRKNAVSMITSRGCPNHCSFCTSRVIWGRTHRFRSPESVINEIKQCIGHFNVSMVNFEDDNLFADRIRSIRLLESLITFQESSGINLEFTAMNGISLEQLDIDMVALMYRAGFREINISLMSHSKKLQERYGRPFDTDQFAIIAESARRYGMNVRAYFILGLPGQTKEEVIKTIAFMKKLKVKFFPSVYYTVDAPEAQWMMQRSSAFYNETEELSRDDLVWLFNQCYDAR